MEDKFYNFSAKSLQGQEVSMETFRGKTVLIVNTASKCALSPQCFGLQALYEKYKDRGLVILGFPCNQFAHQEPGDNEAIAKGSIADFGITFPMFAKVEVNGKRAHPLFKYLKKELKGSFGSSIKWNFTKFLLSSKGNPIKRFAPTTSPEKIERYIIKLLPIKE